MYQKAKMSNDIELYLVVCPFFICFDLFASLLLSLLLSYALEMIRCFSRPHAVEIAVLNLYNGI